MPSTKRCLRLRAPKQLRVVYGGTLCFKAVGVAQHQVLPEDGESSPKRAGLGRLGFDKSTARSGCDGCHTICSLFEGVVRDNNPHRNFLPYDLTDYIGHGISVGARCRLAGDSLHDWTETRGSFVSLCYSEKL
jgi:hypothetical protein